MQVKAYKDVKKDDSITNVWDSIAALMPNRSKLDCKNRLTQLRSKFKTKKPVT